MYFDKNYMNEKVKYQKLLIKRDFHEVKGKKWIYFILYNLTKFCGVLGFWGRLRDKVDECITKLNR